MNTRRRQCKLTTCLNGYDNICSVVDYLSAGKNCGGEEGDAQKSSEDVETFLFPDNDGFGVNMLNVLLAFYVKEGLVVSWFLKRSGSLNRKLKAS